MGNAWDTRKRLTIAERLDKYAPMGAPDDCWEWIGHRDAKGYGRLNINRKTVRSHRIAYEAAYGEIPDGLHILHSCDNPACVNPRHLRAGTNAENRHEAWQRGRYHHAKLTPQDVISIRASREPSAKLSERYGVRQSQIWRIRAGKRGNGILMLIKEA